MGDILDGMFVGMLIQDEHRELIRLIKAGQARIAYEGASGFLGLGKVRLIENPKPTAA